MPLNHNVFNKRTYTVGVLIIFAILGFLVFRECTPKIDSTALELAIQSYHRVKLENDSIKDEVFRRDKLRDSLQKNNALLKTRIIEYQAKNIQYAGDVNSISRQLSESRSKKDTAQYIQSCDSLQKLADNQQGVIANQDITTQALIDNYDQQLNVADSTHTALIAINNKLQTGYDFAIQETKRQHQANKQTTKQLRREKTKTRILAGALLAAISYGIVNSLK